MKQETIDYSGGGKEGDETYYSGQVTVDFPETVDEAVQRWGTDVCLSKINAAVTIDFQRVCRAHKGDSEKAQAACDTFQPGVARTRSGGTSQSALGKMLAELKKTNPEAYATIVAAAEEKMAG